MHKILIIGDLMLDCYVFGSSNRISPEAPVPIMAQNKLKYVVGGAGNVAANCSLRINDVVLVGALSNDNAGKLFQKQMSSYKNIKAKYLRNERTTMKTRFIANGQQMLRVDDESVFNIASTEIRHALKKPNNFEYAIISDYAKGVCCNIQSVIAENPDIKFFVDPKGASFEKYSGAFAITPNESEFKIAVNDTSDVTEMIISAQKALRKLNIEYVIITRASKGALVIWRNGFYEIKTERVEIADVTGAGDVFISTLACGVAKGLAILDACKNAVYDATVSVTKLGTASFPSRVAYQQPKLVHYPSVLKKLKNERVGKTLAVTNGCFDIIHAGHIEYLKSCAKLADILVILLNSDDSVFRLKGQGRPINSVLFRSTVLESIKGVDYVIVFESDTPLDLIKEIKPDLLVKGGDYDGKEIVGDSYVRSYGGTVRTIPIKHNISTTKIIRQIVS